MTLLPPTGFSDSRELVEAEVERENDSRDWNGHAIDARRESLGRISFEAMETMLAR